MRNKVAWIVAAAVVFGAAGCDFGGLGYQEPEPPVGEAEMRGLYVVQSGDTTRWGELPGNFPVAPLIPFELHWTVWGDQGTLRMRLVTSECGKIYECGPDYTACPKVEFKVDGKYSEAGVLVSGLPGGQEYQISLFYRVPNGGTGCCEWIDLTSYPDAVGDVGKIKLTPLAQSDE